MNSVGFGLNLIVLIQMFMYWNNKFEPKKTEETPE